VKTWWGVIEFMNHDLPSAPEVGIFWDVSGALIIAGQIRKNVHLPLSIGGEPDAEYRCSAYLGVTTSFSFVRHFEGSERILKGGGEMARKQDAQ